MTPRPLSPHDASEAPDTFEALRSLVRAQLDAGARASSVSYAMAYVATELGLVVATDRADVYPVVLSAITAAAEADEARRRAEQAEEVGAHHPELSAARPAGAPIH